MKTSLCHADADSIEVCGRDLVEELLGQVSFADMVGLMLFGSLPSEPHRRMIDALLIVLIEHGLVGPAIAARLTYHSAPDSLQGAVAASLLSAGSRHLGTSELCAQMLQEGLAVQPDVPLPELAAELVRERLARRDRVHGVGHGFHHGGDPRADRLLSLADEVGVSGVHCELIGEISRALGEAHGALRPVNVTGAIAAISSDMGLDWRLAKSFALIGRCLGTLAHIQEELREPIAREVGELVERNVEYVPRPAGDL